MKAPTLKAVTLRSLRSHLLARRFAVPKLQRNFVWDGGLQQLRRVMKSHLIRVGNDDGVWERGVVTAFKHFRQQRLALICAEFERAAGMKLFRKS